MTNVFAVVGEHRWEPGRLLLLGEDGRYYAYRTNGAPIEVEPGAAWHLDEEALAAARATPDPPRPNRSGTSASRVTPERASRSQEAHRSGRPA